MSGKSKIKTKVGEQTIKDKKLMEMFNQMVGAGDPDPNIVVPKYDKLLELSNSIIAMLTKFCNSPFAEIFHKDFSYSFEEIREFISNSSQELKSLTLEESKNGLFTGQELQQINSDPEKLAAFLANVNSKYNLNELKEAYPSLKQCFTLQNFVIIAKNLKQVLFLEKEQSKSDTHDLENVKNLRMGFIKNSPGDQLHIFDFSSLDIKQISYNENLFDKDQQHYLLYFLHILYKKTINIVELITSPDIDIDQFSEVLVSSISKLRQQLPKCGKAFNKIENSVNMLKGNFSGYYKDFVSSGNPGIIIENFVTDVSNDQKADAQTTMQFRTIINFYKQRMKSQVADPNLKRMLKMATDNLAVLEDDGGDEKTRGKSNGKSSGKSKEKIDEKPEYSREEIEESYLPDHLRKKQKAKSKGKPKGKK